ncbi:MAG: hydrogenase formation protein HypD, partial [Bacteroidota bacterium]
IKAREYMQQVFKPRDDWWRGLGILKKSGLEIREAYNQYDAEHVIPVETETDDSDGGCICGDVLKGLKEPGECKLFGIYCTPATPAGACMVSSEGACQAFYKYKRYE